MLEQGTSTNAWSNLGVASAGLRLAKRGAGDPESLAVFPQQAKPRITSVCGGELAFVVHPLGDQAGLSTGCGAEVEHRLAGFGVEQIDG